MEVAVCDTIDLWEAWIDLSAGETCVLYVVGEVNTSAGKGVPLLLKKTVQGAAATHLLLELVTVGSGTQVRHAEVRYAEPLPTIWKYHKITICAGEDVIANISDIELVQ